MIPPQASVVLITATFARQSPASIHRAVSELADLAQTAGLHIIHQAQYPLKAIHPRTFLSPGHIQALQEATLPGTPVLIFNHELSPSQLRNLSEQTLCPAFTRTDLILSIFAMHAQSPLSKLQVQLASLQYQKPRLKGAYQHWSHTAAGIGSRGPGETQLENDRRQIDKKIHRIHQQLQTMDQQRHTQRKKRLSSFCVTLVGYTNAGKSSLLRALTGAESLIQDQLFVTLDTCSRRLYLPDAGEVIITDTVGFIQDLPPLLVQAFHSTLEDTSQAHLLLHVVDAASPFREESMRDVQDTLDILQTQSIPMCWVFNKIDLLSPEALYDLQTRYPKAFFVSAKRKKDIPQLRARIAHYKTHTQAFTSPHPTADTP